VNPFDSERTVARYAAGRPYHHGRTVRRALGDRRSGRALDVACGTGLSTRALAELGMDPVGVDAVPAMVVWARRSTGLPYAVGSAEALPVADRSVDLVTVSSGVHWFPPARFAAEAARVLRPAGALLLYEHAGARLPDEPAFEDWMRAHQRRHPAPPRGALAGRAEPDGFVPVAAEQWADLVPFDRDAFADYLMSQSNVAGEPDSVRDRLVAELAPFFPGTREVAFSASYQLLAAPPTGTRP